jgi:hypothetical protein
MKKRIISMLIVVTMVVSILLTTAFASGDLEAQGGIQSYPRSVEVGPFVFEFVDCDWYEYSWFCISNQFGAFPVCSGDFGRHLVFRNGENELPAPLRIEFHGDPEIGYEIPTFEPYSMGDVNGDGVIDLMDAHEILDYLAKIPNNMISQEGVGSDVWNAAIVSPEGKKRNEPSIFCALEILKFIVGLNNFITKETDKFYSTENLFSVTLQAYQGNMIMMGPNFNAFLPGGTATGLWTPKDSTLRVWSRIRGQRNISANEKIFYLIVKDSPGGDVAYGTITMKGSIELTYEGEEKQIIPVDFTISNDFMRGHVLGRNEIYIDDALAVLKHLAGVQRIEPNTPQWRAAALTNPDTISINDVLKILKHLAGISTINN